MTAAILDTGALLKMFLWSLAAGLSVALVFSFAILGATRSSELRRANRSGAAAGYVALAAVGVVLSVGIIVFGVAVVARKS